MKTNTFGCKQSPDKIGILLAQLGTPDAPTKQALKPYLKQFLSDPRVVETNRVLWWFILNLIILQRRPARSAALYKRVWTEEGSPLLLLSQSLSDKLQANLQQLSPSIEVTFGMRYGNPSLESAIDQLLEAGCTKLLLFPMYPQYSAATTASTYDVVFPHLLKRRFVPTLRVAEPYYRHPAYIKALTTRIHETLNDLESPPEKLLLSYHGVPQAYVDKGDPYCCQCSETTAALEQTLSFPKEDIMHVYQSRFGNDPWLQPYTDDTVEELAKSGVKHIALAAPGFTADCLETIDELGVEAKEVFEEHGGEHLTLIPCLNDHPTWLEAITEILTEELGSWLQTDTRGCQISCEIRCPSKNAQS